MRTPVNGDHRKTARAPTVKPRPKKAKPRLNRKQASDAKSKRRRVEPRAIDPLKAKFGAEIIHRQDEVWDYCVEVVPIDRGTPPELAQKILTQVGIDADLRGFIVLYCLAPVRLPTEKCASKSRRPKATPKTSGRRESRSRNDKRG